jgi:hypothetical protein
MEWDPGAYKSLHKDRSKPDFKNKRNYIPGEKGFGFK